MTNRQAQLHQLVSLRNGWNLDTLKLKNRKGMETGDNLWFDVANGDDLTPDWPLAAIRLGGDLCVIDCDTQAAEEKMIEQFEDLPVTLVAHTPHGTHYYYRWPEFLRRPSSMLGLFTEQSAVLKNKTNYVKNEGFKRGVDFLINGIVFTAPSDGYEFVNPDTEVAFMPTEMAEYFQLVCSTLSPRALDLSLAGWGARFRTMGWGGFTEQPDQVAAPRRRPLNRWIADNTVVETQTELSQPDALEAHQTGDAIRRWFNYGPIQMPVGQPLMVDEVAQTVNNTVGEEIDSVLDAQLNRTLW